ncbi:MAG: hypothetical protein KDJ35_03130 [Alphaproteobacteria bacterium]|nr:hypothetical protein [Alphaproteobacteria bacterium]
MKSFDWSSLKKYASPKAADDLNDFLEKIPQNTNQTMLIIAGVVWGLAGATGLYTTVQLQQLTELRAELSEAKALQPAVPKIVDKPVDPGQVSAFIDQMKGIYSGLDVKASGGSVTITAESTGYYGQFREAISHVQNGGSGWRVNLDRLCVGRECERSPLAASLKINKVSVDKSG